MLRKSSLVECVSVIHGTGVYKASIFFYSSVYVQPCLSKNLKHTFNTIKSSLTLAYEWKNMHFTMATHRHRDSDLPTLGPGYFFFNFRVIY